MFFDVIFKTVPPTIVTLSPYESTYLLRAGDSLGPITCSAECSPNCSYFWSRMEQSELLIANIQPSQDGEYTCNATNALGTSSSPPIFVEVQCKFNNLFRLS